MTVSDQTYIKAYEIEHIDLPLSVLFVRHGQPDMAAQDSKLGPSLSSLGKRQASRVAKRLSGVKLDHIYCSDLARAHQTALPITKCHPRLKLDISKDLREVVSYHFVPITHERGPDNPDALARERDAIARFVNCLRHSHEPGQKIAVVAHGNIIRTLMPILGGRDAQESLLIDLFHTSVSILEVWKSGEAILKLANCVTHLLPKQVT